MDSSMQHSEPTNKAKFSQKITFKKMLNLHFDTALKMDLMSKIKFSLYFLNLCCFFHLWQLFLNGLLDFQKNEEIQWA